MKFTGSAKIILMSATILTSILSLAGSNNNLVYSGRIVRPDGAVINSGTISFELKIYDNTKNCLLWAENQSQDMSGSQGAFSLTIGTGTRVDGGSHTLIQAFVNAGTLSSLTCGAGSSYSPGTTDDRQLVVSFNDGSETVALNPMPIKAVPFALQAEQVNGYGILNLARISGAGSNNTFTPLKHDFLFNLSAAGTASATPCTTGEILKFNGTAWVCAADAAGGGAAGNSSYSSLGLVQFDTDASTSGLNVAAGIASVNYGTAANQIVKLDSSAKLPAVDGSAIVALSAGNISTGTLPVARGGTNSSTALNNNRLMVSNTGAITEAAALTNGQLLIGSTGAAPVAAAITAGSGITVTNAAGSITIAATGGGTVTSVTGSGAISSSGGSTPAISIADSAYGTKGTVSILTDAATSGLTVASGVLSVNFGTGANQIVKLDGTGKLPAIDGSALTNISASNLGSTVVPVANGGTNSSTALTNGKVMVSTGGAIVEGMASNTASSANTFIMRDGSGNISAALGTFDGINVNAGSNLTLNGSTSGNVVVASPAAPTSYTLTLPTGAGTSGQVLSTNGSGITSWISALTSNNGFINGGNSFGANASIGTNDNFDLDIKTNNTSKITVKADGSIGIGTNSPSQKFEVAGNIALSGATNSIQKNNDTSALDLYGGTAYSNGAKVSLYGENEATNAGRAVIAYGGSTVGSLALSNGYFQIFRRNSSGIQTVLHADMNGNIGIGTTAPGYKIEVAGTTGTVAERISGGGLSIGDGSGFLGFHSTHQVPGNRYFTGFSYSNAGGSLMLNGEAGRVNLNFSNNASYPLAFHSSNWNGTTWDLTERLRIDGSTGNVGIGTTAPASTLDVNGDLSSRGMTAPSLSAAGTGKIYFDSTANKFKVSQNGGAFADLVAAGGGGTVSGTTGYLPKFTSSSAVGDSVMAESSGMIGIGTAAPGSKLQISGNGSEHVYLTMQANSNSYRTGLELGRYGAESSLCFLAGPGACSSVGGAGDLVLENDTANLIVSARNATGNILFTTGSTDSTKVTILNNGNMGIKNTAPATLLHVGAAAVASATAVAKFQNADGTCTMTPASSGSGIACSSDERLKENIRRLPSGFALDKISQIEAVTYSFKSDPNSNLHTGFLAQEIQKIAPEFVRLNEDGLYQIYYDGLIPWITEAIKTLKDKNLALEAKTEKLEKENLEIKKFLCAKDSSPPFCQNL